MASTDASSSAASALLAAAVAEGGASAAAPAAAIEKRAPGDFVRSLVGRPVGVRLSDGTEYRGILVCLDGFMNVAMEQAEEYSEGSLKNKLGDCFIRGNNGARAGRAARSCAPLPRRPLSVHSTLTHAHPFLRPPRSSRSSLSVLYISTPKRK